MNSFLLQWFRRLRLTLFLFVPALAHAEVAATSVADTVVAVPKLVYRCGKSVYYLRDETGITQACRAFWAFLTRTPEEIYAAELAEAQQGAWNGHEYGLKQAKTTGYCVTEVVTFCVGGEILKGVRGLVRVEKVVELSQEIKLLGPAGDPGCTFMNLAEKAVEGVSAGGKVASLRPVGKFLETVNDVIVNPSLVNGESYAYIRCAIGSPKGWVSSVMTRTRNTNKGWILRQVNTTGQPTGRLLQYHPGSVRHFSGKPYWKVVDGTNVFRFPAS